MLNYLLFCLISIQCVTAVLELHFSWLLSSKAYLKVCFEVQKVQLPFLSCKSLLLGTNVPNDTLNVRLQINVYAND